MKKSILKGTLIIVIISLIAKLIGVFFRIPLTSLIGEYGMGLFSFPTKFFLPIVALITSGPSIAIAKLISESESHERSGYSYQVKKTALTFMFQIGLVVTIIMTILGFILVNTLWPREVLLPFLSLIPAPIFLSITAVYKGYYQGKQNMIPIASQQLVDGLARLIIGLLLATLLLSQGINLAAAGGTFGTSAGAILGLLTYLVYSKMLESNKEKCKTDKSLRKEIRKKILKIAIPVSVSAVGATLIGLIDSLLIKNRLLYIGYTEEGMIKLNGVLSNVDTLISLPLIIGTAISLNALPNIVAAKKSGKNYTETRIRSMMIMLISVSLPAGVGLFVVGKDIFSFLFKDMSTDHYLIEILSISAILIMINTGLTSILQAMNKEKVPVKHMYIGLSVKLVTSFVLLSFSYINIHGAAISTLLTYLIIVVLNLRICLQVNLKIDFKYMIVVPIISTTMMAVIVIYTNSINPSIIFTGLAIIFGAVSYAIFMLIFKVVDIKHVPLLRRISRK